MKKLNKSNFVVELTKEELVTIQCALFIYQDITHKKLQEYIGTNSEPYYNTIYNSVQKLTMDVFDINAMK